MSADKILAQFQATGVQTCFHGRHIEPQIFADLDGTNWRLKDYVARGGYQALRKVLGLDGGEPLLERIDEASFIAGSEELLAEPERRTQGVAPTSKGNARIHFSIDSLGFVVDRARRNRSDGSRVRGLLALGDRGKLGLIYRRQHTPTLVGYSDSDYAGDVDNRRSTSGYVFMLSGAAITWKSTLQSTVALSTAEAEYMGLTDAAKEAIYLRNLLSDFGLSPTSPVLVYGDNQSSIAISRNPINHSAMKHVHVKHHFVREKVENGDIELRYIPIAKMLADAMTKPLKQVTSYWSSFSKK